MAIVRERREPLTYDDHRRAALSAGIWAIVPTQLFWSALNAYSTDWWALFYFLYPTALMMIFFQIFVLAVGYLLVGWLVDKAMLRGSTWTSYPFVLAGSTWLVAAVTLNWWVYGLSTKVWVYGLMAIIGAHAGWRYYLRLCTEKEVAA